MSQIESARIDAYHEAGHAVAAIVFDTGLISVDIRPQRVPGGGIGRAGANLVRPQDSDILGCGEEAVMPFLVTLIAGWAAEKRVSPNAKIEHEHSQSDGQMVRRYAIGAVCTPIREKGCIVLRSEELDEKANRISALIELAQQHTEEFVARYGAAIDAVAGQLLAKNVLSAAEVKAIVAANSAA